MVVAKKFPFSHGVSTGLELSIIFNGFNQTTLGKPENATVKPVFQGYCVYYIVLKKLEVLSLEKEFSQFHFKLT